jgi:hypothetical protein
VNKYKSRYETALNKAEIINDKIADLIDIFPLTDIGAFIIIGKLQEALSILESHIEHTLSCVEEE